VDRRLIVFFASNALLLLLCILVNNRISAWSISFMLPGLFIVLPALYMRFFPALACALLTGFWMDAAYPALPFGSFAFLFTLITLSFYPLRTRFRPENNFHPTMIALVLNGLLLLVLGITLASGQWASTAYWQRFFTDALLAQGVLLTIAPWFFNLQRSSLVLFGLKIDPEDMPLR